MDTTGTARPSTVEKEHSLRPKTEQIRERTAKPREKRSTKQEYNLDTPIHTDTYIILVLKEQSQQKEKREKTHDKRGSNTFDRGHLRSEPPNCINQYTRRTHIKSNWKPTASFIPPERAPLTPYVPYSRRELLQATDQTDTINHRSSLMSATGLQQVNQKADRCFCKNEK